MAAKREIKLTTDYGNKRVNYYYKSDPYIQYVEIQHWCEENFAPYTWHFYGYRFFFTHKKNLTWFNLKWS